MASRWTHHLDEHAIRSVVDTGTCALGAQYAADGMVVSVSGRGAPAFLISLKAGGSGLTLTEADFVLVLDPWWNPVVEAQAVDRTHRIGQTRNAMVYRLVSAGTIEEKVMALKARKQELVASVLADDLPSTPSSLDGDDLRELFGL